MIAPDYGSGLQGMKADDEGKIVPGWASFSLPNWYVTKTYPNLAGTDKTKGDAFYQRLAKGVNRTVDRVWTERGLALPNGNWVNAVGAALVPEVGKEDAYALANWAGGAALVKTWKGVSTAVVGSSDFLDAEALLGAGVQGQVNMAKALGRLKTANLAAHEYVVRVLGAKAACKKMQEDIQYQQDTDKVIHKELEIVKDVVVLPVKVADAALEAAKKAADGAGKAFDGAAWILANLYWIVPSALVAGGYVIWRNRQGVMELVKTAAAFTPAGRVAALTGVLKKNPRRKRRRVKTARA